MCGIVALFTRMESMEERRSTLVEMTRTLRHRGPDHQGEWWDARVPLGLAQRRLSIVDLTPGGHQPMVSKSERYVVSFNGEIYNFEALRGDLEKRGVSFHGRSDTEVLLAAIETDGLNTTCQKINGMFAIILWDRKRQELHLIRDRLGKKPLYFGWAGNDFICASELRAFMAHPNFVRRVSGVALQHYLHLGFIPAPYSIFESVSMLTPGCRMVIPLGDLKPGADLRAWMDPYWSPARVIEESRARVVSYDPTHRMIQMESTIEQAVVSRMVADVPLGAFLSGGVDSSLVVALMQKNSVRPVQTYNIGFDVPGYDESAHAARVAGHLGTDHHSRTLTVDEALSVIHEIPHLCDEPMADISFLPTYLVARFARENLTVALTGDGGDELFGGYYRHTHMSGILNLLRFLPGPARAGVQRIMRRLAPLLARDPQTRAHLDKLAGVIGRYDLPQIYEFLAGMGEDNAVTSAPRSLLGYPFRTSRDWPTGLKIPEWMMFADTVHYLPNNVLTKVDRATMAASLEARAPLLDREVFAQAWALPIQDKIQGRVGKVILRRILERHMPRELFDRPKQGFAVPIGEWMRGAFYKEAARALFSGALEKHFALTSADIQKIWDDHQSGVKPAPQTLWRLYILARWAETYLG